LGSQPSPFTPLSTLMMGDLLKDVIPPGVVNWVAGGNETGAYLVNHPDVSAVCYWPHGSLYSIFHAWPTNPHQR
jgi:acyl-CoA reductase-like NAD-dependent aldehyde dehydrogenase